MVARSWGACFGAEKPLTLAAASNWGCRLQLFVVPAAPSFAAIFTVPLLQRRVEA